MPRFNLSVTKQFAAQVGGKVLKVLLAALLMAALGLSYAFGADKDSGPNDPAVTPEKDSKPTLRTSEGFVRREFLKAAGKDTVLGGEEEFRAAINATLELINLSDTVQRSSFKATDRDSDGSVDWFEFRNLIYAGPGRPPTTRKTLERPSQIKGAPNATNDAEPASRPSAFITEHVGGRAFSVPGPVADFASLYKDDEELFKIALAGDRNQDGTIDREEMALCRETIGNVRKQRMNEEIRAFENEREERVRQPPRPEQRVPTVKKTLEEKRTEVLAAHDSNGDGALQVDEWRSFVNVARLERKNHIAGQDGKFEGVERIVWQSNDNALLWTYSFDKDRDGVLDDEETREFSTRMREDPSFIRGRPPVLDELEPLNRIQGE